MRDESMSIMLGIAKKAGSIVLVVVLVMSINFVTFMVLPGDPAASMAPKGSNPDLYERIVEEARLNDPLLVQYVDYVLDTFTGDFRVSSSSRPLADIQEFIWDGVGRTLALLSLGLLGSFAIGVALERIAWGGRGRTRSTLVHGLSLLLIFVPAFSLALTILFVNVELGLGLPISGSSPVGTGSDGYEVLWSSALEHALLPVSTIILSTTGLVVLYLREGLRDCRREGAANGPWLSTFASGLVSLRPVVHFIVAWTMTAVLLVDIAFSYGGLGEHMWNAMNNMDIPVLMATTFLIPMMVMGTSSILSLSFHLLGEGRLREALNDWGHRITDAVPRKSEATANLTTLRSWLVGVWKSFRSSATGMSAMTVLVIMIAVGALAPVLAVSSDPNVDLEPTHFPDWINPLPPSLEPSPYTDMIHPLGTDQIGRDAYSLWLFGARDAAIIMITSAAGMVTIGLAVGIAASKTADVAGLPARVLDFFLTAGARAMVATPILVLIVARTTATGSDDFSLATMVLAFYAWAWVLVARPIRERARTAGRRVDTGWMTPSILAASLSVAKFGVPLITATHISLRTIGLGFGDGLDWGTMTYSAFSWSAPIAGDWHLIIPPMVGVLIVCSCAFVLLDRAEHAVRTTSSFPSLNS